MFRHKRTLYLKLNFRPIYNWRPTWNFTRTQTSTMAKTGQVLSAVLAGAVTQVNFTESLREVAPDTFVSPSAAGDVSELSPSAREEMRYQQARRQFISNSKNVQDLIEDINPGVFDMVNLEALQQIDKEVTRKRLIEASDEYRKGKEQKRITMLFHSISEAHRRIGRLETYIERLKDRDMKLCAENAQLRDNATFWRHECDSAKVAKTTMACRVEDLLIEREQLKSKLTQQSELSKPSGIVPPKRLKRYERMNQPLDVWCQQSKN